MLIQTGQVAKTLGVTNQTVHNWCKAGMPHTLITEGEHKGEKRFDLAAATAWRDANRKDPIKGGTREGAGRKRRRTATEKATPQLPLSEAEAIAALPPDQQAEARARQAELDAEEKRMDRFRRMIENGEAGFSEALAKMSKTDAERILRVIETRRAKLELDETAGKLIEKETADLAWAEALTWTRSGLETFPQRLEALLRPLLGLDAAGAELVRRTTQKAIRDLCETMAENPLAAVG